MEPEDFSQSFYFDQKNLGNLRENHCDADSAAFSCLATTGLMALPCWKAMVSSLAFCADTLEFSSWSKVSLYHQSRFTLSVCKRLEYKSQSQFNNFYETWNSKAGTLSPCGKGHMVMQPVLTDCLIHMLWKQRGWAQYWWAVSQGLCYCLYSGHAPGVLCLQSGHVSPRYDSHGHCQHWTPGLHLLCFWWIHSLFR